MKRLLLLLLVPLAMAQYSPPTAGQAPGGTAGGDLSGSYPNPGTAKLNGVAASNYVQSGSAPWLCKPASASGSAYTCTPTLLDGTAISASLLAAPVAGQQVILVPDVASTGGATLTIDGTNAKGIRLIDGLNQLVANDLASNLPQALYWRAPSGRWVAPIPVMSANVGVQNTGTNAKPVFSLSAPVLRGVTGSISGNLTLGTCDTGTATVTGATTAMVAVASPTTNPGTGVVWNAYVSAADTVTVAECGLAIVTPSATTYQVAVIQ